MKVLLISLLSPLLSVSAQAITWNATHESVVEKSTLALANRLPAQTALIGRTGLPGTRTAVVISEEGHILSPFIRSIDGEDVPYLLYKPDGSRVALTTVAENAKRSLALLKLEDADSKLLPVRIARLVNHTVVLPVTAPIASIGEPASLYVEHLEFAPPEDAKSFRIDGIFQKPGSPVLDLTGALIGITLKAQDDFTPVLMIANIIADLPELDDILPMESQSELSKLPLAPEASREEIKEISDSPLTAAREKYAQTTHPSPLPCVQIFNENTQATHSIIGTIVQPDGLILTKASELGPALRVRYAGKNYPGVLLSTDEETDLALVAINEKNMPVIRWTDEPPQSGTSTAAPVLLQETTEDMVAEPTSYLGTYSHLLKERTPNLQASSRITSLGLTTEQLESGVIIAAIKSDTPAFESGLARGDIIESVDGNTIKSRGDLTSVLDQHEVGDEVVVKVKRGSSSQEFTVRLIAPLMIPPATGVSLANGIPMIPSVRRAPFPDVLVHTTPLNAWDCGSPLFDLKGRAFGLNIAAVAPTRTLALTPRDIRAALDRLLSKTQTF